MRTKPETVLYVVVNITDPYELPLFVGTAQEIADHYNISRNTIYEAISSCKRRGIRCRYIRVEGDDNIE